MRTIRRDEKTIRRDEKQFAETRTIRRDEKTIRRDERTIRRDERTIRRDEHHLLVNHFLDIIRRSRHRELTTVLRTLRLRPPFLSKYLPYMEAAV